MPSLAKPLMGLVHSVIDSLEQAFLDLTLPSRHSVVFTTALDITRARAELIAENALLRQQLIILHRQVKKPHFTQADRLLFVLLASRVRRWKEAILIFKPDTLLRWHRQGFRLFWKLKSRNRGGRPKLASETIAWIQQMARENRLWGAERIRGELMKLGIRVAKTTIQKYVRLARPCPADGQNWSTFLKNYAHLVLACDFLPVIDLLFRQIYAFFIIELGSRRVVHFGVTCPSRKPHPPENELGSDLEYTPMMDSDSLTRDQFACLTQLTGLSDAFAPYCPLWNKPTSTSPGPLAILSFSPQRSMSPVARPNSSPRMLSSASSWSSSIA